MEQLLIKILIVAGLIAIAARVIIPSRGSRSTAVRRLLLLGFFGTAIYAVFNPDSLSAIASLLGVGRGSDLLLYALIVVFLGNLLSATRKLNMTNANLTVLARDQAINSAQAPVVR